MYKKKGVLYFNPGSCGPRRFELPIHDWDADDAVDTFRQKRAMACIGVCALRMHFAKGIVPLMSTLIAIAAAATGAGLLLSGAQQSRPNQSSPEEQPDKYTWLEDIHGERQMDWVRQKMSAPPRCWKRTLTLPRWRPKR
jgi:hypothetical protein